MSECSKKLSALSKTEQALISQKQLLIEKRKREIGELAARQDVLTLSDEIWLGIFKEVSDAMHNNDERIQQWQAKDTQFFRCKKQNCHAIENSQRETVSPTA